MQEEQWGRGPLCLIAIEQLLEINGTAARPWSGAAVNLHAAVGGQVEVVGRRPLTGEQRRSVSARFHHSYWPGSRLGHPQLINRSSWSAGEHVSRRCDRTDWTFFFLRRSKHLALCKRRAALHHSTESLAAAPAGRHNSHNFHRRSGVCGTPSGRRRPSDSACPLQSSACAWAPRCRRGNEREVKAVWHGAH